MKMRLIVSGYGENEECLNLVEVDLKNKYVNFLDGAILNQASYVISRLRKWERRPKIQGMF